MPDGVMAAQVTLTHLVIVRIYVGQPLLMNPRPVAPQQGEGGLCEIPEPPVKIALRLIPV